MASGSLRCGRISYTNDLPVYAAFDASAVAFPGELVPGVPARLNQAMLDGSLQCGPMSSFFYAKHAGEFVLFGDVCIGSRCDVRSIYCVSHVPPSRLAGETIAVTTESATGRALFDVLCRTRYGFAPEFAESSDPLREFRERGRPCVVIGDTAIDAYVDHPECAYDLGSLWHDATGADMVYAVWAARKESMATRRDEIAAAARALRASLDWGLAHLDAVIDRAQATISRPAGFYAGYYRALNFRFDDRARAGLRAFLEACASCGLLDVAPAPVFLDEELARA
jgi:chorismate dehydratase